METGVVDADDGNALPENLDLYPRVVQLLADGRVNVTADRTVRILPA